MMKSAVIALLERKTREHAVTNLAVELVKVESHLKSSLTLLGGVRVAP